MLRFALTKLVEIVGEAAKQVSTPTREEHNTVPWTAAARMRDRLVHHYYDTPAGEWTGQFDRRGRAGE